MITATNLTKSFGAVTAVNNLSFEVHEGEIFGLVGPDGAGKTTAMRLLTNVLEPTSGTCSVDGHCAYMPQRFALYEDLTVMENIEFYADIYTVPRFQYKKTLDRLFAFSKLSPFRDRLAGNLSGGMKQKLGLVCALIHMPKVLFLDEPTNGVDPVSRRDFWQILHELLKENVTIFISTAYLDEAERCKRVGLLHQGKLLRCETPQAIRDEQGAQTLEEAFIKIIQTAST
jgi:ABC-2 type transport system ATP-binding protein